MGPIARRMWRRSGFLPAVSDIYDGPATCASATTSARSACAWPATSTRSTVDITGRERFSTNFPAASNCRRQMTVAVGDNHAEARITERPPQGGYSVAGVGAPPFALG